MLLSLKGKIKPESPTLNHIIIQPFYSQVIKNESTIRRPKEIRIIPQIILITNKAVLFLERMPDNLPDNPIKRIIGDKTVPNPKARA